MVLVTTVHVKVSVLYAMRSQIGTAYFYCYLQGYEVNIKFLCLQVICILYLQVFHFFLSSEVNAQTEGVSSDSNGMHMVLIQVTHKIENTRVKK